MSRERGSEEPVPSETRREGDAHAFSNGINALLITCPERKIYLSSPRICDQGISASVLLRDENWKWDGTMGGRRGVGLKVLSAMETFSRFQCAADLKFISLFKGLFFCSRSRVFIFFCETKMRGARRNPVFPVPNDSRGTVLLLSCSRDSSFNFTWMHRAFFIQ